MPAMASFRILVVDDDPGVVTALSRLLSQFGQVRFALNGTDAIAALAKGPVDLILMDIAMPEMSGFELCTRLQENQDWSSIPVIMISGHDEESDQLTSFAFGAEDFLSKPLRAAQVVPRVRARLETKHKEDRLRHIARFDTLTGLPNRGHFDEAYARQWEWSQRVQKPLSVLMFDIDFFKKYNDRYGVHAGDDCLKSVSDSLCHAIRRPTDVVARFGGEEFVAFLAETTAEGAMLVAQRVLESIARLAIKHEASSAARHVTLSIGVSCREHNHAETGLNPEAVTSTALLKAADRALYVSKKSGRNRASLLTLHDSINEIVKETSPLEDNGELAQDRIGHG